MINSTCDYHIFSSILQVAPGGARLRGCKSGELPIGPDFRRTGAAREGATLCSHYNALRTAASGIGLPLLPLDYSK